MCVIGVHLDACNSTLQRQSLYALAAAQAWEHNISRKSHPVCVWRLHHTRPWCMTWASALTLILPWISKLTSSHVAASSISDEYARSDASLVLEVTKRLVSAFVIIWLDYCNAALAGLPQTTLLPLQWAQNTAMRLIANSRQRDHITPVMKQLHWLPINLHIMFKLSLMMHSVVTQQCPRFMSVITMLTAVSSTWAGLRSANGFSFWKRKIWTRRGECLSLWCWVLGTCGMDFPTLLFPVDHRY